MTHELLTCKRVCLIGPSSSGKTTLGRKLSEKLGVPFLSLDVLNFDPRWQERPRENFRAVHAQWMEKDGWVIEGNYSRTMPERMENAQAVLFFDFNRFGALYRYLRRMLKHYGQCRTDAPEGCVEAFNWDMIQWILFRTARNRKKYRTMLTAYPHLKIYHLRRFSEVKALYKALGIPWGV